MAKNCYDLMKDFCMEKKKEINPLKRKVEKFVNDENVGKNK